MGALRRLIVVICFADIANILCPLAQLTKNDCRIIVLSPEEQSTYRRSDHAMLLSTLDVKFGDGPISDAVRLDPEGFEICISWNINEDAIERSESGDIIAVDSTRQRTFDACRGILTTSASPGFGWEQMRQQRREAGSGTQSVARRFLVVLRSRVRFLDPAVLAATEVKYFVDDDVFRRVESPPSAAPSPILSPPHAAEEAAAAAAPSPGAIQPRPCRAAVCVSGQWRTFALPEVRKGFRDNLLGGLSREGCFLDVFFYAKTMDAVSDRNIFFARTASIPTNEASIMSTIEAEFPELMAAHTSSLERGGKGRLAVVHDDPPLVPRDKRHASKKSDDDIADAADELDDMSSSWVNRHLKVAWPALSSVRECFELVRAAEENEVLLTTSEIIENITDATGGSPQVPRSYPQKQRKNYYDWVIRTRFDLVYLWPLPPLTPPLISILEPASTSSRAATASSNSFDHGRVHVPYTSLPISDVFAVAPRHLAPAYFEADEECIPLQFRRQTQKRPRGHCRQQRRPLHPSDFQRGAGPTEELLLRHLVSNLGNRVDGHDSDVDDGSRDDYRDNYGACEESETELEDLDGKQSAFVTRQWRHQQHVKVRLHEFPLSIARADPDTKCQGLPVMGLPCMLLVEAPGWGLPFANSVECTTAATLAIASRCNRLMSDQGRGLQLGRAWLLRDQLIRIEDSMRAFLKHSADMENKDSGEDNNRETFREEGCDDTEAPDDTNGTLTSTTIDMAAAEVERVQLPVPHTITLGADPTVVAENEAISMAVPRYIKIVFNQHEHETLLARDALGCLFVDHLTSSSSQETFPPSPALRFPRHLSACLDNSTSLESTNRDSPPPSSSFYVSEYFSAWNTATWSHLDEFIVAS